MKSFLQVLYLYRERPSIYRVLIAMSSSKTGAMVALLSHGYIDAVERSI